MNNWIHPYWDFLKLSTNYWNIKTDLNAPKWNYWKCLFGVLKYDRIFYAFQLSPFLFTSWFGRHDPWSWEKDRKQILKLSVLISLYRIIQHLLYLRPDIHLPKTWIVSRRVYPVGKKYIHQVCFWIYPYTSTRKTGMTEGFR